MEPVSSVRPVSGCDRDRGAVLVISLILVVVMALIALGLARFASTGLTTSDVTDQRTQGTADATGAMYYVLEELTKKQFAACSYVDGDGTDYSIPSAPPPNVVPNGSTVTYSCADLADAPTGHPKYRVAANATLPSGYETTITVDVQVPDDDYTVQIDRWIES